MVTDQVEVMEFGHCDDGSDVVLAACRCSPEFSLRLNLQNTEQIRHLLANVDADV